MGKSDIRILPPLVNGKLSGVLEFGVDHVEITEKLFRNEDSNFQVQIIWWGETKPLFLRSKKTNFVTEDNKRVSVDEQDGFIVQYEVRTKTKLFKSYLSKCDEIEVSVKDSLKNEVIGSAFLKNLIHLIYDVESFTSSIISYSGDVIGKITCHFKLHKNVLGVKSHKPQTTGIDLVPDEKWNCNDLRINLNLKDLYSPREEFLNVSESSRVDKEDSAKNFNIHYNTPVSRISGLQCVDSQRDWKTNAYVINADSETLEQSPKKVMVFAETEIKCADSVNSVENMTSESAEHDCEKKKTPPTKQKQSLRKDEEITNKIQNPNLKDSSKITNKIPSINVKETTEKRLPKARTIKRDKVVRGVRKDKGNSPENNVMMVPKCNKTTKSVVKPINNMKAFAKISNEISKLNKLYLNCDLENVPVKESMKDEDSQKEAEIAMITCEHSQSVKDAENVELDKTDRNGVKNSEKINVNNKLFFDLSDPIEKLYYETFFHDPEILDNNEFEIAELLNQPENKYKLEANPQEGIRPSVENKLQTKDDVNSRSDSPVDVRRGESSSNDGECDVSDGKTFENSKTIKEYKSDCHRCKYYKKLSELDKIIDALRNFETKLRTEVSDQPETNFIGDHHECGEMESENHESSETIDVGVNSNSLSDFSKDDSDFIEFRRYLAKR